jgi:hypothetical protein
MCSDDGRDDLVAGFRDEIFLWLASRVSHEAFAVARAEVVEIPVP